ncbi:response regulator [Flavisolibacter ginsenosidimutans]|uniref:Response regulator n=1 Tax=Flavisolibacter ginsenosidimutans TaxID=661481 RepID=A0A5B8UFP0_9BACT|nr:response regulator [Flavisolibacter ginsenosidimutans]QEC55293.1 response regulator [Flavisolibacter ginsenosidimutans]
MKKILVIEDNREILENTAEILELSHYEVATASNGKIGVEQALTQKPDLILCDIMMPELDGYGVLHMVQKNPDLQNTPFIFLTAKTEKEEMRKGMSLGADDYITKPFDPTDLLNAIEGRLKKAELIKERISAGLNGVNQLISITGGEKALHNFVEGRHVDLYKKKQRIYNEGNHPIHLYFVLKGKVKNYKTNDEGKELIVRIASEGDFFGYSALLENSVYKENADAIEDSEIVGLPRKEFEELMNANPEVSRRFVRLLASDVAEKEDQLIRVAYNSLRKKVADALLTVYKTFKDNPGKPINLSRENLAAVAGTATESLIRTLTDFRAEKLIEITDGKITILNAEKLEKMLN